jgi:ubiquinone/menaquinone biosynthesis C-methylase UbiE
MPALSLKLDTPDLAAHYESASLERQFKTGRLLTAKIGIRPGDRVLDVGSGTGLLAEYVASIVGPNGFVQAIDPLPLRIEIAKRKAKPNLQFAVGDAYALDEFPDGSFDVVYLNAVFHWFPEKLAPLRNFHRLLKPGGKLGLSTGSKDHPNRIHGIQQQVLAREPYRAFSQPQQGLPHRVGADELRGLLAQTGFDVHTLDIEPNTNIHIDAEAAIKHSQASSFGNLLGHLPEDLRERARRDVVTELDAYRTAEGIRQDGARIVAVAIKR